MSTRRDLIWFKKSYTPSATISKNTFFTISATANSTNLFWGVPLATAGAHKALRGNIEQIVVHSATALAGTNLDIMVFSNAAAGTNLATESYLDHESFVKGDWITHNATVAVAAAGGLSIPFVDLDGAHKFHFGIKYGQTLVTGSGAQIQLRWAWRADRGEA